MKLKSILKSFKYSISFAVVLLLLLMGTKLFQDKAWFLATFFYCSAALIIYVYSISKKTPAKYLLPGVLLLTLFHIYPAFYSGAVAFTNDSNGHQLSKEQAIAAIIQDSTVPIDSLQPIRYQTLVAKDSSKVSILFQYPESTYWIGNSGSIEKYDPSPTNLAPDGTVLNVQGFDVLTPSEANNYISELQTLTVEVDLGISLQPQDLENLEVFQPSFTYDATKDELVNVVTGEIYSPNDNGQMVSTSGEVLLPGWKSNVGWRNFTSILTDEEIRRPLLAVLVWTFANAFLLVSYGADFGFNLQLPVPSFKEVLPYDLYHPTCNSKCSISSCVVRSLHSRNWRD